MVRILFIDDDPEAVESAIEYIAEKLGEFERWTKNFEAGRERIRSLDPDIVVLDIWKGKPGDSEAEGLNVLELIWDQKFSPVVVYSADPKIIENAKAYEHPLVESIQKGSGSDESVFRVVQRLLPLVTSIREGEESIKQAFSVAMREVAPYAFENFEDEDQRTDTIVRAGRRRVAALMDEPTSDDTLIASWEQYVAPPITPHPQLGDILRKQSCECNDPRSYRLVLTPSCDMVSTKTRKAKVKQVLVAKCFSAREGLEAVGMRDRPRPARLATNAILTQGYLDGIVPIPELQGKIPTMAANLRKLELVPLDEIGLSDEPFRRIASIDSPFRELISWAYMQISSRPGLPDRDTSAWAVEIVESFSTEVGQTLSLLRDT